MRTEIHTPLCNPQTSSVGLHNFPHTHTAVSIYSVWALRLNCVPYCQMRRSWINHIKYRVCHQHYDSDCTLQTLALAQLGSIYSIPVIWLQRNLKRRFKKFLIALSKGQYFNLFPCLWRWFQHHRQLLSYNSRSGPGQSSHNKAEESLKVTAENRVGASARTLTCKPEADPSVTFVLQKHIYRFDSESLMSCVWRVCLDRFCTLATLNSWRFHLRS